MVASDDGGIRAEYHFPANGQRCFRAIEHAAFRNAAPVADAEVVQPFQVAACGAQVHVFATMLHAMLVNRAP